MAMFVDKCAYASLVQCMLCVLRVLCYMLCKFNAMFYDAHYAKHYVEH